MGLTAQVAKMLSNGSKITRSVATSSILISSKLKNNTITVLMVKASAPFKTKTSRIKLLLPVKIISKRRRHLIMVKLNC